MLPKESLPSNNMTSVLEKNVFNSPQNRMMNYLMPLGWWMMPLDKLASVQMTNTSVKTRWCSFPPLSDGTDRPIRSHSMGTHLLLHTCSGFPDHFQYGKYQMPHRYSSPFSWNTCSKKQKTKASKQVLSSMSLNCKSSPKSILTFQPTAHPSPQLNLFQEQTLSGECHSPRYPPGIVCICWLSRQPTF